MGHLGNILMLLEDKLEDFHHIFRVPPNIRRVDPDAYDPKLISLGPYHRGNAVLEEMEAWKARCLMRFLNRIPGPRPMYLQGRLGDCAMKLTGLIETAREQYSGVVDMSRQEFLEMMMLDGCFILEILMNPLEVGSSLVVVDMLLLENQVPFFILEKLFELVAETVNGTFVELAFNFVKLVLQVDLEPPEDIASCHLLHLLYSCTAPRVSGRDADPLLLQQDSWITIERGTESVSIPQNEQAEEECLKKSIPSAGRLAKAGVKFKKMGNGPPFNATFENVLLKITPLKISEGTGIVLQNLIVFERLCLKARHVVDYLFLVDCLVDSSRDVKILAKDGVLVNGLVCEEKVVDAIKRVSRNFTWGCGSEHRYEGLFLDVNRYCRSPRNRWRRMVQVLRDREYWSMMGYFLAAYALCFTSVQTYFTIKSYDNS